MDDLWFEDELEPLSDAIEAQVKAAGVDGEKSLASQELRESVRGIVRADFPRWKRLGEAPLTAGRSATLWKVRLRFQFDLNAENSRFVSALCEAPIKSITTGEPDPSVYDLYPKDLYKGELQVVSLKFNPNITVGNVSASIAEISTNMDVGEITPVIVGFSGTDERSPYWKLRSKSHPLLGTRTFWLVLEQPEGCSGILLRTRVEGTIQTKWGLFAIYPKERVWDNRPGIVIQ